MISTQDSSSGDINSWSIERWSNINSWYGIILGMQHVGLTHHIHQVNYDQKMTCIVSFLINYEDFWTTSCKFWARRRVALHAVAQSKSLMRESKWHFASCPMRHMLFNIAFASCNVLHHINPGSFKWICTRLIGTEKSISWKYCMMIRL